VHCKVHHTACYEFTYLDIGAGDDVRLVAGLAGGPHLVLPLPLERQTGKHDGLG
jgi:hypothetical protein